MAANMTVYLNAREAVEAIEDIGIGEVAVQCFHALFVRVLADPRLLPQKRQFLLGLQSASAAHKGFGKGAVTVHEMLDSYASLTDALRRIKKAHPQLKVCKSAQGLALLIEQIEGCLKWA